MSVALARPLPQRNGNTKRHALLATSHARLMMLMLLFGAGALLIVMRLAWLAVFTEPATSRDAAAALVPLRADIVDRNGAPLARTIDALPTASPLFCGPARFLPPLKIAKSAPISLVKCHRFSTGGTCAAASTITGTPRACARSTTHSSGSVLRLRCTPAIVVDTVSAV